MTDLYKQVADLLARAEHILFITGAGISADSGLPTYRGIGGLYENQATEEGIPIEIAISGEMFRRRPELTWKYLWQIGSACLNAEPNRGHEVIAQIEKLKPDTWTLTQNVDGLHHAAGTKNLVEIHGRASELYCLRCGNSFTADELIAGYKGETPLPPKCPHCDGLIRPKVVLFGEMLPQEALQLYYNKATVNRDLVVLIGTSGLFQYIAQPALVAKARGIPTVEINPEQTRLTPILDYHIGESAATALDLLWNMMQEP
jgi:NAD-dependent deacetylase